MNRSKIGGIDLPIKNLSPTSIKESLRFSHRLMIAATLIPILLISLFYLISMNQYKTIIENVNNANEIRSSVAPDINGALWAQITGKPLKNKDPITVISGYEAKLARLKKSASTTELRQTAVVASRILESIEHYAWQIDSNINNDRPVEENEKILNEIYEVNELLEDTLGDYVASEINVSNQRNTQISNTIIVLVLIELFLVFVLLIFIRYFQRYLDRTIQEPLSNFSKMTSEISQGNWQTRVANVHVTELDTLGNNLNTMANQIEILFDENTQKQKSLALSELKVLQAQITPHFIYNTLDAIVALARQEDTERVEEITYALSNFFKISLNKGNEWTTIAREIQHIESYLEILKIRYGPILNYQLSINPKLMQELTLKMILHPLVENAIYHGIKKKRGRGMIEISVSSEGRKLLFRVKDNGLGMDQGELSYVKANLSKVITDDSYSDDLHGYGLYNVYRRLKLYYGDRADLRIESQYEKGTCVTIIMPKKEDNYD